MYALSLAAWLWATTSDASSRMVTVFLTRVEGGATCVGKTVVDELAYSINGVSKHYGTPINPAAHARVPGGSCSGAAVAVAVAANLVDFSLRDGEDEVKQCVDAKLNGNTILRQLKDGNFD
ncbi:hypothetical protein Patl1_11282 [Pistacia atlantica]|uniref:Uncharacterized protein n=1 Tax=Pistacia atlantica TaxID=434234 RepID=A0ACC1A584_9ROSI|nr:hypothetical protein Patl1_11282 [Pistacia atlantica]